MFMKIKRTPGTEDLPLPKQATVGSAGIDLLYAGKDDLVLLPGHREIVPTGISIALAHGFEGQVRSRSGLAAKHGVVVLNSPGTIDADYRGEIGVIMMNFGDNLFPIRRGDRIAQLVVSRVERVSLCVADSWDTTERGTGGFGSTGTNSLDVA